MFKPRFKDTETGEFYRTKISYVIKDLVDDIKNTYRNYGFCSAVGDSLIAATVLPGIWNETANPFDTSFVRINNKSI